MSSMPVVCYGLQSEMALDAYHDACTALAGTTVQVSVHNTDLYAILQ